MKQQFYKIKELFKELINPYYQVRKEQEARAERFSILERPTKKYDKVGLIPFEEFEKEAGITETRDDLGKHLISCT